MELVRKIKLEGMMTNYEVVKKDENDYIGENDGTVDNVEAGEMEMKGCWFGHEVGGQVGGDGQEPAGAVGHGHECAGGEELPMIVNLTENFKLNFL